MQFLSVLSLAALAAIAQAQSTTVTNPSSPTSTTVPSEVEECLAQCTPGDLVCESPCIAVPNPNEAQINATTTCIADCDQGDGSEQSINDYTECRDGCILTHYYDPEAGTPNPSGTPNSPDGDEDEDEDEDDEDGATGTADSDSPTRTGDSEPSGTGDASTESDAPDAAPGALLGSSVGLLGLAAAMIAL